MNFSVEAECGYTTTETWGGGNFSGVCHGKDQAVSLNKLALIPELSCIFWVLIQDVFKTPECVLTCQGN